MKRRLLLLTLCLTLFGGVAHDLTAQENPNPNADLDQLILTEMAFEHLPGVSTVMVKDGQIIWLQSYGMADVENQVPVTPNTVFLLASISKLFTGMSVMHLAAETSFTIDDNVNSHLPWSVAIPGFEGSAVTPR
jgi:CubicO group peptidase (beta-lactamase class C family)